MTESAKVYGASVIRLLAVLAGVGFFAYLYGRWMNETWLATTKVEVDSDDVKIATALAGALGGLFAAALGVEKRGERNAPGLQATFTVGTTLSGTGEAIDPRAIAATVAVWVYFLTGVAAAATWYWNRAVAPDAIKVLAEIMGGYILALIAALGALETK